MRNRFVPGAVVLAGDTALDDAELIARAREGDAGSFGELVRRYQEAAFRAAFLVLHDAAEAEDAAQEAFVRAYRALHRFRAGSAFRPWLLRIVMNQALTMAKGRTRRAAAAERLGRQQAFSYSIDETVIDRERARQMAAALQALREQERAIIYLRYFLSLSERELAEYLGCPPGTVKSRLHRALEKLRRIVEKQYPQMAAETA